MVKRKVQNKKIFLKKKKEDIKDRIKKTKGKKGGQWRRRQDKAE